MVVCTHAESRREERVEEEWEGQNERESETREERGGTHTRADIEKPAEGKRERTWLWPAAVDNLESVALPAGLACDRQKRARSGDAALKERINPV